VLVAVGLAAVLVVAGTAAYVAVSGEYSDHLDAYVVRDPTLALAGLSRSSAPSGSVLRLEVAGALPPAALVEFAGATDRSFSPAFATGSAVQTLVPLIRAKQQLGGGEVRVRLLVHRGPVWAASDAAAFTIEAPKATRAPSGSMTLFTLEVIRALLAQNEAWASAAIAQAAPVTPEYRAAIAKLRSEADALASLVDTIMSRGPLGFAELDGAIVRRDELALPDQLFAAQLRGLGPASPSPCGDAKDREVESVAGDPGISPALVKEAARRYLRHLTTCPSQELADIARRTTGWTRTVTHQFVTDLVEAPKLAGLIVITVASLGDEAVAAARLWKTAIDGISLKDFVIEKQAKIEIGESSDVYLIYDVPVADGASKRVKKRLTDELRRAAEQNSTLGRIIEQRRQARDLERVMLEAIGGDEPLIRDASARERIARVEPRPTATTAAQPSTTPARTPTPTPRLAARDVLIGLGDLPFDGYAQTQDYSDSREGGPGWYRSFTAQDPTDHYYWIGALVSDLRSTGKDAKVWVDEGTCRYLGTSTVIRTSDLATARIGDAARACLIEVRLAQGGTSKLVKLYAGSGNWGVVLTANTRLAGNDAAVRLLALLGQHQLRTIEALQAGLPRPSRPTLEVAASPAPATTPVGLPPTPTLSVVGLPPTPAPLRFVAAQPPSALAGQRYQHSFCSPTPATPTSACGPFPQTTNPTGGSPPYHFQLGSGVGFPPIGISLGKDGLLTGTPSAPGTYRFEVCAVDLSANSVCQTVSMTVTAPSTPSIEERWAGRWTGPYTGTASTAERSGPCSRNTAGNIIVVVTVSGTSWNVSVVAPSAHLYAGGTCASKRLSDLERTITAAVTPAGDQVTLRQTRGDQYYSQTDEVTLTRTASGITGSIKHTHVEGSTAAPSYTLTTSLTFTASK
jgi:hypothetical protein